LFFVSLSSFLHKKIRTPIVRQTDGDIHPSFRNEWWWVVVVQFLRTYEYLVPTNARVSRTGNRTQIE